MKKITEFTANNGKKYKLTLNMSAIIWLEEATGQSFFDFVKSFGEADNSSSPPFKNFALIFTACMYDLYPEMTEDDIKSVMNGFDFTSFAQLVGDVLSSSMPSDEAEVDDEKKSKKVKEAN